MTDITIRNVDEQLKERLLTRASGHGQSMEAEARDILRQALQEERVSTSASTNLYEAIRQIVEPFGDIDIGLPMRQLVREPPNFE